MILPSVRFADSSPQGGEPLLHEKETLAMITIREYVKPRTTEEAWELLQKPGSRILGGMMWLRQSSENIRTGVDISSLGLDFIEDGPEYVRIGAMTALRSLETSEALCALTGGAMKKALSPIVGVQFRNLATIGGSLWGRFGFSDLLTLFLALDATVELYKAGLIPLKDFAEMKKDKDLLLAVRIPKKDRLLSYQALRIQATDFPVLNLCASKTGGTIKIAVGARPGRARLYEVPEELEAAAPEKIGEWLSSVVPTEGNIRGSAEYRSRLVSVLAKRALTEIREAEK